MARPLPDTKKRKTKREGLEVAVHADSPGGAGRKFGWRVPWCLFDLQEFVVVFIILFSSSKRKKVFSSLTVYKD
jgi:hypothetical protein